MVTNYTPEGCKYSVSKLIKSVYLISEEAVKDIRIDNGDAWVESVSQAPIRLDCYSITLQEDETLDERYKFVHTLTFSVNGYANKDDFQGRFYAIVKDNEGTYWLINPLFPCKVTYTYTLGYQQNHTDFTMATASNHPVLRLKNMVSSDEYVCHDYWLDGIDELWLNERKYTVHDGSTVKYTNDGFKSVVYNKRTGTFTETFDGNDTNHQVDFDILFSQYKDSWHYNLLEFKDNLYSAIIKTTGGKYALCGFSFGLQPSFQVNADDTAQSIDRIHITLQDAHDVGDAISLFNDITEVPLTEKTYVYTSEYDGYECVGDGIAKYLLQKEIDALGNETGNYKVLAGYAERFPMLNIVGEFNDVVTFPRSECRIVPCMLQTSLPSSIMFTSTGSQTYTLKAGSDWTITHDQSILVSPESGNADVNYTITVTNPNQPTAEASVTTLKVNYCNGLEHDTTITVQTDADGCFPQGAVYNISANMQILTVPTTCCVSQVRETTTVGVSIVISNSYIQVTVPENNSGSYRTMTLLVTFCDGKSATITINQSNIFEKWIDAPGTFCIDHDLYKRQDLWTGETSTSYVITPTYRNVLIEANSEQCYGSDEWIYDWTVVDGYVCDDCESIKCTIETSGDTHYVYGSGEITREEVSAYSLSATGLLIHNTVTGVAANAFSGFTALEYSRIPSSVVSIGNYAFCGNYAMVSCEVPYGATSIGTAAFSGCTSLSYVSIPSTVTNIGASAFANCQSFMELSIPSGITEIPQSLFYNADGLLNIVLPSSVLQIGNNAFNSCSGLYSVTILAEDPPMIGTGVFDNTNSGLKIYVPSNSVTIYKGTGGWSNLADKIFPIT